MPDVVCLGEALIDWMCPERGATLATATSFVRAPGGAPANVAVGLARLGVATGFLGRLSTDPWGEALLELLRREGIAVDRVVRDPDAGTRMAYILLDEQGERYLAAFSRGPSADAHLMVRDVRPEHFDDVKALYMGSLPQATAGSAKAVDRAIGLAQEEGAIVVYDPNYRPVLWSDPQKARDAIAATAARCDVLKFDASELRFLTGEQDLWKAARDAQERFLNALVVVTDGPRGCFYVRDADEGHVPGLPVHAVDPTGAGDGFVAGMLAGLLPYVEGDLHEAIANLEGGRLRGVLQRANGLGAMVTTRAGAMTALPRAAELDAWLAASGVTLHT